MRNFHKPFLIAGVFVCVVLSYFLNRKISAEYRGPVTIKFAHNNTSASAPTQPQEHSTEVVHFSSKTIPKNTLSAKLTKENFETMVDGCLDGLVCHIAGDPLDLYEFFKKDSRRPAAKLLITFMQTKIQEPQYSDIYKGPLKVMIEDFYSGVEEKEQLNKYQESLTTLRTLQEASERTPAQVRLKEKTKRL